MEKMIFRVEWGYWHGYFSKEYLRKMDFSGHISVNGGTLECVEKIVFKHDDWGPHVFSRQYEMLPSNSWNSRIHNWLEGIRFSAYVDESSVIILYTNMIKVKFSVGELIRKRHLVFNPAEKYSYAVIHVEIDDEKTYWFTPKLKDNQTMISFEDFDKNSMIVNMFTLTGKMIARRQNARANFSLNKKSAKAVGSNIQSRLRVRYLLSASDKTEVKIRAIARFKILINGQEVWQNRKFSMWHDVNDQLLEEVWTNIDSATLIDGKNTIEVINEDYFANVIMQNLVIEQNENAHLEVISSPTWVLTGEPFSVTVKSNYASSLIKLNYDKEIFEETINGICEETYPRLKSPGSLNVHEEDKLLLSIGEGEHEFFFVAKKSVNGAAIEFCDEWRNISSQVIIPEVWDLMHEDVPVKTGFEVRTGSPYEYIEIIKDAYKNQLGNLAVFRDYHNLPYDPSALWDAAEYCRKHRIYTDTICVQEQTTVARASGEFCQSLGSHEFTGIFYGREKPQNITASMRDSMHQAISALAEACEIYRYKDIPVATGDASGGARYAYMAGFDILRHETFVGHHTLMLTGARGSARAFGKDNWGVHIASQHNAHPELEMGLRRFWLGMFMPWVYGCSFAFEEDTLYQLFKYIRSAGEDFMTKGKYNITKQFNKYVSTHPRDGECQVDIAILQGRYAPPFTGISSANDGNDNPYANENFPVWGHTGRQEWEWGFRQPEKGFHLFEIFAPGIFLPPLHQKKADVRKFFSGNPHGEFDQLPVEALVDVFKKYKFIALLSWHTMEYSIKEEIDRKANIPNDYFKFIEYVKNGGTLFMSIPHLTTRADRAFLKQMEDLKLYNDSNVQSLCGVRVCGKSGTEFCGEAELNESPECFDFNKNLNVKQNKIPSRNESEDGPCMIADVSLEGAEVILADKASGKPLLVRNKIGNGYVYLLLTYAYPGHEALKDLMPKILLAIVGEVKKTRQIQVTDSSGEIYWSNWKKDDSSGRVYMLNTDWTKPGNEKKAVVEKGNIRLSCNVLQGEIKQVIYFKNGMIHSANADDYLAIPQKMNNGRFEFTLQCPKNTEIKIVASKTYEVYIGENVVGKTQPNKEISFVIFNNSETMKYRISLTES